MVIANVLLIVHLTFILFVVLGGFLVLKWPRLGWLHMPAVVWGLLIETAGLNCPLTSLENHYLARAGHEGYSGDFIVQYLLPIIYPDDLTTEIQLVLAGLVVMINSVLYYYVFKRKVRYDPINRE